MDSNSEEKAPVQKDVENEKKMEKMFSTSEMSTAEAMSKTTTISTIAVQSGKLRIVIALLHVGDWISLKILEITPELTTLGATLEESLALQGAHDEVLRQLQNKQSPVEELLRQADQLIATQRPRAEVYAAMAESLARAWKDINSTLEIRKRILDLLVQYHVRAEEFKSLSLALENSCSDTVVPVAVEIVKRFITELHDQRRALLEALRGALQAGDTLISCLRELGKRGSLDSRPNGIQSGVEKAIAQVGSWMDELHLKRQTIDITFNRRKIQLEQCLALAILGADLRELEETIHNRREMLANSDQLGDYSSSAELLYFEHKKLLPEAHQLQEKALKITKATEQLVASGCFAGEEATAHAYGVLAATSEYLDNLQIRDGLLERAVAFFTSAQTALNKLDQLEIQLTATEYPTTSAQLARLHAQCAAAIYEVTQAPIAEGHGLLQSAAEGVGRGGADGVRRRVQELEDRRICLEGRCVAHKEENRRINEALEYFLEKYGQLVCWLKEVGEMQLEGRKDMGNNRITAQDFVEWHSKLLGDLQLKGTEINTLLLTLPPILEHLDDGQRRDVDNKVEELHERWMKLKGLLEGRLELGKIYARFHTEAASVEDEMDRLQDRLVSSESLSDDDMTAIGEQWESIGEMFKSAKNTGLTFQSMAKQVLDRLLDIDRACSCVDAVLEELGRRQLTVTRHWQSVHTEITTRKELLVKLEETMAESNKTLTWVSKLDSQLYPVLTTDATKASDVSTFLQERLNAVVPDIKRAQTEVEQRIQAAEVLIAKSQEAANDQRTVLVKNKLAELNQRLLDVSTDYQVLLQVMMGYFDTLAELDKTTDSLNQQFQKAGYPKDLGLTESLIREHEASRQAVEEMFKYTLGEYQKITNRINRQEPVQVAAHDIEKLKYALDLRKLSWDKQCIERSQALEIHQQICSFDRDLTQMNKTLDELNDQLNTVKGNYGDSLSSAEVTKQNFMNFEKTIQAVELRIQEFLESGQKLVAANHKESPQIEQQISDLENRWRNLKKSVLEIDNCLNLSMQYFKLVDEANDWFREGGRVLVGIARKSPSVRTPEEAQILINEIETFLKPGEQRQNIRIQQITDLANQIYGSTIPGQHSQVQHVMSENQKTLESFSAVIEELQVLARNLQKAEEEKQQLQLEQEAEEARLAAERAQAEALAKIRLQEEAEKMARELEAAKRAQMEADEARKRSEEEAKRIAEEAAAEAERIRQAAEEAKRLAEAEAARINEEAKKAAEAALAKEAERAAAEDARKKAESEAKRIAEESKRIADEAQRAKEAALNEARRVAEEEKSSILEHHLEITEIHVQKSDLQKEKTPDNMVVEEAEDGEAPQFTSPLSDESIQEGARFTFHCRVRGVPRPDITWYKDGIPIRNNPDYQTSVEDGLCSLTIEETLAEDSAKYTCKATNSRGVAETNANLTVLETVVEETLVPPSFATTISPAVVSQGTAHRWECRVEGNPLPSVSWYKGGDCLDSHPDYHVVFNNGIAILEIEKIRGQDQGEYTCKASNELGTAKCTANLIVTASEPSEGPRFTTPLSNVMARAGQKVKLECEFSGLPTPTLTWSHNGKTIKETRELKLYSDAPTKAALVIQEAFPKDAGQYQVTAINPSGQATSSCSVSVKGRLPQETSDSELASDMEPIKPAIQQLLKDATVKEGESVRLDCVIVGQPEPEVIWYHNERPVKESHDFRLLFQGDRCTLIIQEAISEDAGEYKVVALNSAGEASSKCTLTVIPGAQKNLEKQTEAPPKFTKLLADILVSEGEKVSFECNVVGEPRPEIKWLLNNNPIPPNDHVRTSYDDKGNVKLEIDSVKPEHKGVYTVKAANSCGDSKCFAQLIVKSFKPSESVQHEEVKQAPVFKEYFHDKAAFENTSTKFECIVVGKPTPKVKWLFNGEPIIGRNFLISTSGDRQVLTIPDVNRSDEGTITCVAENEAGKASCAARLSVQQFSAIALPESQFPDISQHSQSSFTIKHELHTESKSSKITTGEPQHVEIHNYHALGAKSFNQINDEAPNIRETHKVEEFKQVNKEPPIISESSISTVTLGTPSQGTKIDGVQRQITQRAGPKGRPPKFMSPVIGTIVDLDAEVLLEGILDGQPTPQVTWTKNGEPLRESDNVTSSYSLNKTTIHIKKATQADAGRYTCTAVNDFGSAVSTADLVVRKTIFPPVFGRRLQAQVFKSGDRMVLEVEVTGTPEPQITWFKDGQPIEDALKHAGGHRIRSVGISHALVVEKATLSHNGRYMVRAVNSGGEAQSIADIAVFEPTPDTMVEVVKTVVFEDVRKQETLSSTSENVSSNYAMIPENTPKPTEIPVVKEYPKPFDHIKPVETTIPIAISRTVETSDEVKTPIPVEICKSADILKTTQMEPMYHEAEQGIAGVTTVREQEIRQEVQKMKLEHPRPDIPSPKPIEPRSTFTPTLQTEYEICRPQSASEKFFEENKISSEETGIETSSISKQSSLQYFVKKIKQEDEPVPKEYTIPEQIRPEIYKKFEDISQKTEIRHEKFEAPAEFRIPVPIEDRPIKPLIGHEYKPFTPEYKTFSSTANTYEEFNLQPEPPAEICYPKPTVQQQQFKEKTNETESLKFHHLPKIEPVEFKPIPPAPKASFYEEKKFSSEKTSEQTFQSSSSSYYESGLKPVTQTLDFRKTPERPSSACSFYSASDRITPRPLSAQSGFGEPSTDALMMEKQWAHKFSESHVEKSWPPPQSEAPKPQPSWSVQSTLEKKWTPVQTKCERIVKESRHISHPIQLVSPVPYYRAEVTEVTHKSNMDVTSHKETSYSKTEHYGQSYESSKNEHILEERNVKPSEVIKSWPPAPPEPQRKAPVFQPLPVRPVSVQDITDEVYLEPGTPPEIAFAEPPKQTRKSYVERVEQSFEKTIERGPEKVPPCAIRTIPPAPKIEPPPLPPKREQPLAPPIPVKAFRSVDSAKSVSTTPYRQFPELEPFPFKPDPERPKLQRSGPPPTPSKFIKGKFTDSDYESELESTKIHPKWKPCASDTEETGYQKVQAPQATQFFKSKSVEREVPPPSKFVEIPQFQGSPRSELNFEACRQKKQAEQIKKETKYFSRIHEARKAFSPPPLKPGSPPIIMDTEKKPKPLSPKVKHKLYSDGYTADTEEAFFYEQQEKKFSKTEEKSEFYSTKTYEESTQKTISEPKVEHFPPQRKQFPAVKKEMPPPPPLITNSYTEHRLEQNQQNAFTKPKGPPQPSPLHFVKGEFKESDYESDYEHRSMQTWSSTRENEFRTIRAPPVTPRSRQAQTGPPRPKFEPIEKFKPSTKPVQKPTVLKPKPVPASQICDIVIATPAVSSNKINLQPGSPPEMAYASAPTKTQYYKSTTSTPYHNAVQTETSNIVHLNEQTDKCHRTMSVQQTRKVITFGDKNKRQSCPPVSMPRKFIPGEFRESDYESEVESTRIKPKWAPSGSDTEDLHYRRVRPPSSSSVRSSSVPPSHERVLTPMEFDTGPPQITVTKDYADSLTKKESYKKFGESRSRNRSFEPPQRSVVPHYNNNKITKSTASKMASEHMDSMTHAFKSKTQKFVSDIMSDVNKQKTQKPILKTSEDGDAQVYREESRASQYGTKHVDPDTGLIYFKYDFGYEFGIILPGESKPGQLPAPPKEKHAPRRHSDIELPVYHESTKGQSASRKVKWEPSSEHEQEIGGSRWEQSSCSPMSLSPSLPSMSPAFNSHYVADSGRKGVDTPPSCPSTPGSIYGKGSQPGQIRSPLFITPLRDIAVVCGQMAKFECIVQSEPQANILWSRNGRIIQNSSDYQLHYRNGVCRLVISQAYPEDAGTYSCTASNPAGTVSTSATLQVPGVPSHMYGTYRQCTLDSQHSHEEERHRFLQSRPVVTQNRYERYVGKFNNCSYRHAYCDVDL